MRYLILFTILLFPNLAADGQEVFNKNFQGVVLIITDDGIGSGAIITEAGHVLTNAHVINDNAQVEVYIFADDEIDNLRHSAKVLKVDKSKDLALLKIANSKFKLNPIKISIVEPRVGEEAHAIGHPDGEIWSYTKGYISQIRDDYEWEYDANSKMRATVLQMQTPINPGNSGGPLLNEHGNLIGINSFGDKELQSINFAVGVEEIIKFLGSGR